MDIYITERIYIYIYAYASLLENSFFESFQKKSYIKKLEIAIAELMSFTEITTMRK